LKHSNCYDYYFQKYALEFFGVTHLWEWFKAQAMAESALNPLAKSPVGAFGVMQLMPGTSSEMAEKLGIDHRPEIQHINIRMGIAYDKRCWDVWGEEDGLDRLRFMFGSYNAGIGNILQAQRFAKVNGLPTDKWDSIGSMLPKVTGNNSIETVYYVTRIQRYFSTMRGNS